MTMKSALTVGETLPKTFLLAVETRGDRPAIREKRFGIWKSVSLAAVARDHARNRLRARMRSASSPATWPQSCSNTVVEWVYADMGVLCAGGVSSGIYPTDSVKQVEYLVNDSRTKVIFVEDDEQLDKVLECRGRCPTLEKIMVFDMEGPRCFLRSDGGVARDVHHGRPRAHGRAASASGSR